MLVFVWVFAWILGLGVLAYHKTSTRTTTAILIFGFILSFTWAPYHWLTTIILVALITSILLPICFSSFRKKYLTLPLLRWFEHHLPKISETERIALEAGTVWWDRELFSGSPDWDKLFKIPAPELTAEEQAFLEGPVEELCNRINDWEICYKLRDLPPDLWQFLKDKGFFALIIPKVYGGLEFSALGHSEILTKIAGCSMTVATVIAVPNSLGPSELLLKYGTPEQRDYYLPRLADGTEMPCFALTGPDAGSDANSIQDTGVICRGDFRGTEILGIRLNWDKRYTTLAPVATLLGLAFKLYDPDHLLGDKTEVGTTCALIPVDMRGITIGQRHMPLSAPFQNGPTQGKNVFIPIEWIIGGPVMAGHGWRMVVECLSAGRAISLPSSATGGIKALTCATGAYARIRRQFKQPIGRFEGVEEVLTRMAGNTYLSDAARILTAACIDRGESPSVLGAIIKYHITERGRQTAIDAMDIHGGKGIMLGPKNYIAPFYQNAPISITVEGANILTRSMIIFGQGAMRSHPYLLREFIASKEEDPNQALIQFDQVLTQHILHTLSNGVRSLWMGITQIRWSRHRYTRQIDRASSAFAFLADMCLLIYGGKLKFKEKISGRLADCLSMMYLASSVLKRFEDEGRPVEDRALVNWVMQDTLSTFWLRIDEILRNLPKRWMGFLLRIIVMPFGKRVYKPSDVLGHEIADLLLSPNPTRDRLFQGVYLTPNPNNPIGQMEIALQKIIEAEQDHTNRALKEEAEKARKSVIAVDYFMPEDY